MRDQVIERFDERVEREPMSGCWLWSGAADRYGYGRFWLDGRIEKAHRAAWMLFCGPIPDGLWVLHRCDVPACVNPSHLFLGDRAANMRDMANKGRQVFQVSPQKINRGERSPMSKLSEDDARAVIRGLAQGESLTTLARRFHVSKPAISAIRTGRTWAHLPREAATA